MLRSVSTRVAGFAILLAAIWGGIIPFLGPYFHFTLGPDHAWAWTQTRLYMDVLPAAAAFLGGLLLLGAGPWAAGRLGAVLALLGGIWFAVGPQVSALWHTGGAEGAPHGSPFVQQMERLGLHTGLGVLIAALAAFALPGFLAARRARREAAIAETAPATTAGPAATAPVAPAGRRPITGRRRVAADEGAVTAEDGATEVVPPERITA